MIATTEVEGFAATVLRSPAGLEATFSPAAGMVGISLRDGGAELLGQRRGVAAYVREAKTMGIPLLHPWANRLAGDAYAAGGADVRLDDGVAGLHRDANGLPIHGLVAGSPLWRTVPAEGGAVARGAAGGGAATTLSAELDLGARPELLRGFPFPHRLRIDVALRGRALTLTTTLTATGEVAVPVAYGFHPYLRLPGVPRAEWRVELPALRRLELDGRGIPTGAGRAEPPAAFALADRALDDGFDAVAPGATFAVEGGGRRIEVRFEQGWPAAQVYAPLAEDVVCFEPMAAPTNALVSGAGLRFAAPGEQDVTRFTIAVAE